MTALFESLPLMISLDVISVPILTYLHFSRIRKPILDSIINLSTVIKDTFYSRTFQCPSSQLGVTPFIHDETPHMPEITQPWTHATVPVGTTPSPGEYIFELL